MQPDSRFRGPKRSAPPGSVGPPQKSFKHGMKTPSPVVKTESRPGHEYPLANGFIQQHLPRYSRQSPQPMQRMASMQHPQPVQRPQNPHHQPPIQPMQPMQPMRRSRSFAPPQTRDQYHSAEAQRCLDELRIEIEKRTQQAANHWAQERLSIADEEFHRMVQDKNAEIRSGDSRNSELAAMLEQEKAQSNHFRQMAEEKDKEIESNAAQIADLAAKLEEQEV